MQAAVMKKIRQIEMEEREIPEPEENQVLIKIEHCGICG